MEISLAINATYLASKCIRCMVKVFYEIHVKIHLRHAYMAKCVTLWP